MNRFRNTLKLLATVVLVLVGWNHFGYPQQKQIYIAPDDHTDYMWSTDEAGYQAAFVNMINFYLDLANSTSSNPPDFQSRFTMDANLWAWVYEKQNPGRFPELISRLQDGHMTMHLTSIPAGYGLMPAEAVIRSMYYAGSLERRFNLRFPLAVSMENQTLPYGLVSLFAGSGGKYSWRGICDCATVVPNAGARQNPMYWWVGPDGSRLLMKWYNLSGSNQGLGGYAEAWDPTGGMNAATNLADTPSYPYLIAGAFGRGWDNIQTLDGSFPAVAQAGTNASRRVVVSNEVDFFQNFETAYGAGLPSISETTGYEWDLGCTSLPETSSGIKRAVEKLRTAEAFSTLVSLKNLGFKRAVADIDERDRANRNLGLYWDHSWMGGPGVSEPARVAWQRRIANEVKNYVDALQTDAGNALGTMISKSGTNIRFYAFNSLSWARTDIADFPYAGSLPVRVVDVTTTLEVPSQIVMLEGQQHIRVLAANIPSVGYKVFEIQPGTPAPLSNAATVAGGVIESSVYRITVNDKGAITSLIDKTRGNRDFAGGGRLINDLFSTNGVSGSPLAPLTVENAGPVSVTLVANHSGPYTHKTRVTLIRDSSLIDIRNEITQNVGAQTVTWTSAFNLNSPDTYTEEVGAILHVKKKSQGGHYSDSSSNSRYDWTSLNHFVDMTGGGVGITLSNADLYTMKLGNSTISNLDISTPQFSVLVRGNIAAGAGVSNQADETYYLHRFAFRTHDSFDQVEAMRFALGHQNPLSTGLVTGGSVYPDASYSFATVSNPNVLIWALKPSDDGIQQGIIARVWNLSGSPESFSFSLGGQIYGAKYATHIETPLENAALLNGSLVDTIAAQQIKTYLLNPFSLATRRREIDNRIKNFKGGTATQQEVIDLINTYMETE